MASPEPTDVPHDATRPAPSATPDTGPGRALADAVRETEEHVAAAGWDAAPRLFALVTTAAALDADASLAARLPADVVAAAAADPHHLLSVEQEDFDAGAHGLDDALARVAWPPTVDGAAVVVERIVLPPSAEADVPADPDEALDHLTNHPQRQDVRLAVGVLRDGSSWCALRSRAHDHAADVAHGPDLVPGLVAALRATFEA